jgi:hypothetical protein
MPVLTVGTLTKNRAGLTFCAAVFLEPLYRTNPVSPGFPPLKCQKFALRAGEAVSIFIIGKPPPLVAVLLAPLLLFLIPVPVLNECLYTAIFQDLIIFRAAVSLVCYEVLWLVAVVFGVMIDVFIEGSGIGRV